jgi:hypothetical protein
MSIKMIAKELYQLEVQVSKLEKQLEEIPFAERDDLIDELRKIKAQREYMRGLIEGAKSPPSYRKPR